jgi:peptide/nickel transport system permease protein
VTRSPERGTERHLRGYLRFMPRGAALAGAIALIAVTVVTAIAPLLAPHDAEIPIDVPYLPPLSSGALLGTDQVGRDVLSRVLFGMQVSWLSALLIVAISACIGTAIGLLAGYVGGILDRVLMAVVDFFLALPAAILAIVIAAVLGPSLKNALIAIGILSWPYYARLVRAEIRSLVARPHVEAARMGGNGHGRIMFRHLLPGAWPVLLVTITLDLGGIIVILAGLSFLGLGRPSPAPELGAMAAQGLPFLITNWWIPIVPATCVAVLALVANLAGDGLRNILKDQ